MIMQKKYIRIFAALLCVCLLATLTACNKKTDPSADSSGDEASETPKTNTEKFIDALDAYETYFNDISDAFGTKLPAVSDHGTAEFQMSVPVFSVFGEAQTDLFDPEKPVMQASIVRAGDFASSVISTMLYGEQMRIETYESATEGYLVFPDLPDQAPIRLTAEEAESSIANGEDAFKKLLDSLGDASEGDSYLMVTEDGDNCTYALRLTAKQVSELLTDMGITLPADEEGTDPTSSSENYMLLDLTTVNGLPTELHIDFYNEGETEAAQVFTLKTSVAGSNTTIDAVLSSYGETVLTANATITSTQGSIAVNATLDMGDTKLTANVKLLAETEASIVLDGTAELRMTMEGDAAFTLPLKVTGKINPDGDGREMALEVSSSSGMFELTLRFEMSYIPGETSVTMPEGAVDADQVDTDALMEALQEAYPQTLGGLLGDGNWGYSDYRSYVSEDETVFVDVYEDNTIYLYTYALEYVDDGKSLTFSYNGKSLGSYAYTAIDDQAVECCGMPMYVTEYEDGGRNLYFESENDEFLWFEIELFLEGSAEINFLLPYETVDGVSKILLPDGTALPFDVILPEDETSPLQIGSLTLPRYVDSDPV